MKTMAAILGLLTSFLLVGYTPRIEVAASKESTAIDMNAKIEYEIHIKVDKDVESLLKSRSDLFRGHDEKIIYNDAGCPKFTQ